MTSQSPLLQMLKTRMHWHQARQRVLAENVANSDSPGFKPRDVRQPDFQQRLAAVAGISLATSHPGHVTSAGSSSEGLTATNAPRFETRPSGNAVSLEEEMLKVAENQGDYQLATSLYARSMAILKTAVGKR